VGWHANNTPRGTHNPVDDVILHAPPKILILQRNEGSATSRNPAVKGTIGTGLSRHMRAEIALDRGVISTIYELLVGLGGTELESPSEKYCYPNPSGRTTVLAATPGPLSIPACVRKPGPIGIAAKGPIRAVQRGARVRIGTTGTHDGGIRHDLPGVVALHRHTIGEGVTRQVKKQRQCRCNDAGDFAHRSVSFD
jgi:hypothetical protein